MVPNNGHLSGLHSVASVSSSLDTKPLHLDAKSLLNSHGVPNTDGATSNSTSSAAAAAAVAAAHAAAIDNKK